MKTSLFRTLLAVVTFLFGYALVSAEASGLGVVKGGFDNFAEAIRSFTDSVVVALGGLFMTGAVVVFFMGIVEYIWGLREGNTDKVNKGNKFMIGGLVALFVMFSVYGIVKLAQSILLPGQETTTITIPKLKFDGAGSGTNGGKSPSCTTPTTCSTNGGSCTLCNGAQGKCQNSVCVP